MNEEIPDLAPAPEPSADFIRTLAAVTPFPVIVHGVPYHTLADIWTTRNGVTLALFLGSNRRLAVSLSEALEILRGTRAPLLLPHPNRRPQRGAVSFELVVSATLLTAWLGTILLFCR
jgi:hypothetical protein